MIRATGNYDTIGRWNVVIEVSAIDQTPVLSREKVPLGAERAQDDSSRVPSGYRARIRAIRSGASPGKLTALRV